MILCLFGTCVSAQECTTLGQNPSTAFPVCGTSVFHQKNVPICSSRSLFVPGCSGDGAEYENKNPFWYKFTCFQSGTLNFTITPTDLSDDYDWQLYDITGLNPDEVYTNRKIIVTGNWAGTLGVTGASPTGANFIQCASDPKENKPSFAKSPNLIAGHQYILLVSHYTDSQSGYSIDFAGGTAVITDLKNPLVASIQPDCSGSKLTVKLNKKIKCSSISASGSEFKVVNGNAAVIATGVSAVGKGCSGGFDTDELTLVLSNPVPGGTYDLMIGKGADGNTLMDHCDTQIPEGYTFGFVYTTPQPIPIDSAGLIGCAPETITLFFSKKINCATIAPNGSNFSISGGYKPFTIISATGKCENGLSDVIILKLNAPIYLAGTFTITPRLAPGGGAIVDECGQIIQPAAVSFTTADTVSARFSYTELKSCKLNSYTFTHDGAHSVMNWNWQVNGSFAADKRVYTAKFPAKSTTGISLTVANARCSHTSTQTIEADNELGALFKMPPVICPEDILVLEDSSYGAIDIWQWDFGTLGRSLLRTPLALSFVRDNKERNHTISLKITSNALNCSDSIRKTLRVLSNCIIAVPNAFTPNGDGINDFLAPNNALKAANMRFSVFNRWGQRVFSTANWQEKWDGKRNGSPQETGVYVWFLDYTNKETGQHVFQKGTTLLMR